VGFGFLHASRIVNGFGGAQIELRGSPSPVPIARPSYSRLTVSPALENRLVVDDAAFAFREPPTASGRVFCRIALTTLIAQSAERLVGRFNPATARAGSKQSARVDTSQQESREA